MRILIRCCFSASLRRAAARLRSSVRSQPLCRNTEIVRHLLLALLSAFFFFRLIFSPVLFSSLLCVCVQILSHRVPFSLFFIFSRFFTFTSLLFTLSLSLDGYRLAHWEAGAIGQYLYNQGKKTREKKLRERGKERGKSILYS